MLRQQRRTPPTSPILRIFCPLHSHFEACSFHPCIMFLAFRFAAGCAPFSPIRAQIACLNFRRMPAALVESRLSGVSNFNARTIGFGFAQLPEEGPVLHDVVPNPESRTFCPQQCAYAPLYPNSFCYLKRFSTSRSAGLNRKTIKASHPKLICRRAWSGGLLFASRRQRGTCLRPDPR
jgi:hypothetical protein